MWMTALDSWHDYLKTRDADALRDISHPALLFESPILHTPRRGREIAVNYLSDAVKALSGPAFRYVGEWRSENGAVLEFENDIEGLGINGVDIITVSDDGSLITHFKMMIRPLKAIDLVGWLMGEELARS